MSLAVNSPYISLDSTQFRADDLEAAVLSIMGSAAMVDATASGSRFTLAAGTQLQLNGTPGYGAIRWNATTAKLEFSNDGGTTWNALAGDSLTWSPSKAYAAGAVVLYDGALYSSLTAGNTGNTPGPGIYWKLVTLGTVVRYVTNSAELTDALSRAQEATTIIMAGTFGSLTATTSASLITIYSDERSTVSGTWAITTPSNGRIYWHCKRTAVSGTVTITAINGTVYIEHLAGAATLSGCIYQRIDGAVSGGTQQVWYGYDPNNKFVPTTVSQQDELAYADSLNLYANAGQGSWGYVGAKTMLDQLGPYAARYFKVDSQGLAENLPLPGSLPVGFVYYATDTGDLYRRGDSTWDTPVHWQGPQGSPGSAGSDGAPGFAPAVTISTISGGHRLNITDATHSIAGQTFDVMDGTDGATPAFEIGEVTVASNVAAATVELTSEGPLAPNSYTFNFALPPGADGETPTVEVYSVDVLSVGQDPYVSNVGEDDTHVSLVFGLPEAFDDTDVMYKANYDSNDTGSIVDSAAMAASASNAANAANAAHALIADTVSMGQVTTTGSLAVAGSSVYSFVSTYVSAHSGGTAGYANSAGYASRAGYASTIALGSIASDAVLAAAGSSVYSFVTDYVSSHTGGTADYASSAGAVAWDDVSDPPDIPSTDEYAQGAITQSGNETAAKAWYYSAIDLTESKIYLCAQQVRPTIGPGVQNAAVTVASTAIGKSFNIKNRSNWCFLAEITAVDGSILTYSGELGFTTIDPDAPLEDDEFTILLEGDPEHGAYSIPRANLAIGRTNKALNYAATAVGREGVVLGKYGLTEGIYNKAGYGAHAEGNRTTAADVAAHAEGSFTGAYGYAAHAEGYATRALGKYSLATGIYTETSVTTMGQLVTGKYNVVVDDALIVVGNGTATDARANALVIRTNGDVYVLSDLVPATISIGRLEGSTKGLYSVVLAPADISAGHSTASGKGALAQGYAVNASNNWAHAEGQSTSASGQGAHAEGGSTAASGLWAHAEGQSNQATAQGAHAEGFGTRATARGAHAEGYGTTAEHEFAHAIGIGTSTGANYQFVAGQYNVANASALIVVGNGTAQTPANALVLSQTGNLTVAGSLTCTTYRKTVTNLSATSIVLDVAAANTDYHYGTLANLTITTVEVSDLEATFDFTANANGCVMSLPATLDSNLVDSPQPGCHYILSIRNNIAIGINVDG